MSTSSLQLTDAEMQMLQEMRDHYRSRVQQASVALQRHDANPMFRRQAERDRLRADLLTKVIENLEFEWG